MAEATATIKIVGKDQASREIKKVNDSIGQLEKSAGKGSKSLKELLSSTSIAKYAGAAGIALVGTEALKAASNLEELTSKAKFVFGSGFADVQRMSSAVANEVGRANSAILQMSADMGSIIGPMGITGHQMEQMSVQLARLAVDMGSFHNVSDADAFVALRSGITGETEAMKRLGVVMTQTNLQAFALEKGIKQKLETMNQAQLTALRYAFIMDKTKTVQGDAARTAGSVANQFKRLKGTAQEALEELGKPTLPAVAKALGFVNSGLEGGIVLFKGIADMVSQATKDLQGFVSWAARAVGIMNGPGIGVAKSGGTIGASDRFKGIASKPTGPDEGLQNWIKELGGVGAGGSGGGAAREIMKVEDAIKDLSTTYDDAAADISKNIYDLEQGHKQKMRDLQEQLEGVENQLADLEASYAKTVASIKAEQEKLTKQSDQSEAEAVIRQEERIKNLRRELEDLAALSESLTTSQVVTLKDRYGSSDALTEKEKSFEGLSSQQARQFDISNQLEKELAAYEEYISKRQGLDDALAEARIRAGQTEFERTISDLTSRREEEEKALKEREDAENERYEKERSSIVEKQDQIKETMEIEREAYTRQRQELESSRAAIDSFKNTYVASLRETDVVTKETVDSMKKNLEDLRKTISEIDALMQARADVTGGGTVASRRAARLASTEDSFLKPFADGGVVSGPTAAMIGEAGTEAIVPLPNGRSIPVEMKAPSNPNVTINMGGVVVKNEADENRLVEKIARLIRLQQLQAA